MQTKRTHRADVVVVGARVAGAATALLLARAGHRVLVVDRAAAPSDTLSTHILAPAAVRQLRRWGLLDQVVDSGAPPTTEMRSVIDGTELTFPWPAPSSDLPALHHPRRTVLDPIVLDAAQAAGATVRTGVSVTDLTRDSDGRVEGVTGRAADGSRVDVRARFVVGADGWRSGVARAVGAPAYDEVGVLNACHYAYWSGLDVEGLETWCSTSGLMAGVVPTNEGACVFLNCHPRRLPELRGHRHARYLHLLSEVAPDLAERLRRATPRSPVRGTPGIPNVKRRPWGPGWVLVGDAGYTKDPISGHGITDAFVGAELAAYAVDAALGGADEARALADYHDRRDGLAAELYRVVLDWASWDWTADELLGIQARYGACLVVEDRAVAQFPEWAGLGDARVPVASAAR